MRSKTTILCSLIIACLSLSLSAQKEDKHGGLAKSLFFHCQTGQGPTLKAVKTDLTIASIMKRAKLDQKAATPEGLPAIRILEFIPSATMEQVVKILGPKEAGAAVEIEIVGKKQNFKRWLVAADHLRDRLSSLIGNWRLVDCKTEEEYHRLQREFSRGRLGNLLVSRQKDDSPLQVAVEIGVKKTTGALNLEIEVVKFLPHFDFDKDHKPTSRSNRNLNPAVLVRLKHEGIEELRWVFARDFDISLQEKKRTPFAIKLECMIVDQKAVANFVLVHRPDNKLVLWSTESPIGSEQLMVPKTAVQVPRSNYKFTIVRQESHAKILEQWREDPKGRDTVLRIETKEKTSKKPVQHWLRLGRPLRLRTTKGLMTVLFAQKKK